MTPFRRLPYQVRILLIAAVVSFSIILSSVLMMRFSSSNSVVTAEKSPVAVDLVSTSSPRVSPNPTVAIANPTSADIKQQPGDRNAIAYGHFPYAQADPEQLVAIGSYASGSQQRFESLNQEAALALMKMIYAARDEGVWIVPVSGFRTVEQQQQLFSAQTKRRGSVEAAAKISAPAGHSEHHTGFALDLTDGKNPKQDITLEFEKSDAYHWLTRRGKEFGFELSFPKDNKQGVIYEPWHWRYVGSANAQAIFADARKVQ